MRRTVLAVLVVSTVALAGCSAGAPIDDAGTVQVYVGDGNAVADRFDRPNATVTVVEVRPVGTAERTASVGGDARVDGAANSSTDVDPVGGDDERVRYTVERVTVSSTVDGTGETLATDEDAGASLPSGEVDGGTPPGDRPRLADPFVGGNGGGPAVSDVAVVEADRCGGVALTPFVADAGDDRSDGPADAQEGSDPAGTGDFGIEATGSIALLGGPGTGATTREGLELRVRGTPTPGGRVTVTVTRNGAPVVSARVVVDGRRVGRTDADGTLRVTLPADGEATLRVEHGPATLAVDLVFG